MMPIPKVREADESTESFNKASKSLVRATTVLKSLASSDESGGMKNKASAVYGMSSGFYSLASGDPSGSLRHLDGVVSGAGTQNEPLTEKDMNYANQMAVQSYEKGDVKTALSWEAKASLAEASLHVKTGLMQDKGQSGTLGSADKNLKRTVETSMNAMSAIYHEL
jgi:hypothetical protein